MPELNNPDKPWYETIGLKRETVEADPFKRLYPFTPKRANINNHEMSYLDVGSGEPVIMVHGNPTWSFFYRQLVNGLKNNWRCLAPDHIGCGFSQKPQNFNYQLDNHIDNLETWIETVLPNNTEFNLVVHDWGGPIGAGYAIRHPHRIKRMVALNTSVFTAGDMPLRIKICRVPGLGEILVRGLNLFAGMATLLTTVKALPAPIRSAFIMPYNSWANRIAVHKFVQDIPFKDGPTRKTLTDIDNNIKSALDGKPLLIQWGMRDWCFTPFFLNLWRERFPNAQVDEYNAGHYLLEDAGDKILEQIRTFLSDGKQNSKDTKARQKESNSEENNPEAGNPEASNSRENSTEENASEGTPA